MMNEMPPELIEYFCYVGMADTSMIDLISRLKSRITMSLTNTRQRKDFLKSHTENRLKELLMGLVITSFENHNVDITYRLIRLTLVNETYNRVILSILEKEQDMRRLLVSFIKSRNHQPHAIRKIADIAVPKPSIEDETIQVSPKVPFELCISIYFALTRNDHVNTLNDNSWLLVQPLCPSKTMPFSSMFALMEEEKTEHHIPRNVKLNGEKDKEVDISLLWPMKAGYGGYHLPLFEMEGCPVSFIKDIEAIKQKVDMDPIERHDQVKKIVLRNARKTLEMHEDHESHILMLKEAESWVKAYKSSLKSNIGDWMHHVLNQGNYDDEDYDNRGMGENDYDNMDGSDSDDDSDSDNMGFD